MKILVACEYSGRVREAFRRLGHDAWSCDLIPSEDNSRNHIIGDVRNIIHWNNWDMMIAFPPCRFLSRAGARWLYPKGILDTKRHIELIKAREFFMELWNAPIEKIAIENPTPFKIAQLPTPSQIIQPYYFGEPYTKRTLLWLNNLPLLQDTMLLSKEDCKAWIQSNTGGAKRGQKSQKGVAKNYADRARTFQGVADAMANQWGRLE